MPDCGARASKMIAAALSGRAADGRKLETCGRRPRRFAAAVLMLLAAAGVASATGAKDDGQEKSGATVFATVGDTVITTEEFRSNLQSEMRRRFFHGAVPDAELASLRHEVAESMVDRVLLAREAKRRGIRPDAARVDAQIGQFDARLGTDPRIAAQRDTLLMDARRQLETDSMIERLREEVGTLPPAADAVVREYYRVHPDKFTTPERVRVSMILLKVEPWTPAAGWSAAQDEAARLLDQLRHGADFAELARLHSADASAERGGDLGYVHRGMFSAETQEVIDALAPGQLSEPVRLLQGYAVFRLDERVRPRLNDYAQAAERARALLQRERQENAWDDLRAQLRRGVRIEIDEAVLSASD